MPPVRVDEPAVVFSPPAKSVVSVSSSPSEMVPVFLKSAVPSNVLFVPLMVMSKSFAPDSSELIVTFPPSSMAPVCDESPRVSV